MTRLYIIFLLSPFSIFAQSFVVNPYLQDVEQDSIVIMWESSTSTQGTVEYGTSPFELNWSVNSTTFVGNGSSQIHTAQLSGLLANTKYYYKVILQGGETSQLYNFKTIHIPDDESSTQFMAISDMQRDGNHPNKFQEIMEDGIAAIVFSEVGTELNELEGILIPGDLVPTGGSYSQWANFFFAQADSIMGYVPMYAVPGNHEYFGGGLPNFKKYFHLPENGPSTLQDECWYKDISNVRIIGLNSNSNGADKAIQLDWLSAVLDSTCSDGDIDFVFAQLHHPYKSELWTPGESSFTGSVIDSLEEFTTVCNKASLHFFGHTHGYSRGQSRDHKHLWVNVATAGGAIDNWGEFPNADYDEFVKSQDEYGFVYIDVEAGDDPSFTMKRYSRGDQDIIVDNILRDEVKVLKEEIPPNMPTGIYPLNTTISSNCLSLKASQFEGIEDSIQGSHWQISNSDTFLTVMAEQWWQNENFYYEENLQENDDLTDADFSDANLVDGDYFWRVRYRNQNLEWSAWSDPLNFSIEGTADTLSGNLILNGDAENGIASWTGDIESLENAECASVTPYEGTHNFAVGGVCANESSEGTAEQTIDLSSFQNEIDTDKISMGFGGYLRDFSGSDRPQMFVELYSNSSLILTSEIIENSTSTWTLVSEIIDIPPGVDECKVILKGIRNAGSDNDSYFDALFMYIVDNLECPPCIGATIVDSDEDGFCDDIDCSDNDPLIYPGARELCNGLDDNCDGLVDFGDTVRWTGAAGTVFWRDSMNWDQQFEPLPCQHVIIDNLGSVILEGNQECLSLEIAENNMLNVDAEANFIINSQNENSNPSAIIHGSMMINGRCFLQKSSGIGFEIHGTLINNNKFNISEVNDEVILIKTGGRFDSLGKTILK